MERDGDQTTNNNGDRAGRGGSQRRPGSTIGRGRRPGGGNQIMVSSTCLIYAKNHSYAVEITKGTSLLVGIVVCQVLLSSWDSQ